MKRPIRIALMMQGNVEWMGGAEYTKNIVLALANVDEETRSDFEISLIRRRNVDSVIYERIVPYLTRTYIEEEMRQRPAGTVFEELRRSLRARIFHEQRDPLDESLEEAGFDFVYPYFTADKTQFRWASWIYDFQHKYLEHFFSQQEIEGRDDTFARFARFAPVVVVSSEGAKVDFDRFYPEAASKSKVLSFKVCPDPSWYGEDPVRVAEEYLLPERFFLVSNQFWQHKNHLVVFEALKRLREKAIYPIVVCTGLFHDHRDLGYTDGILQVLRKYDISQQVCLLGVIPRSHQVQLIRRAIAVIQPSLFEGWSTVVEEARCFGKPAVLSDIPVHREQNPPEAHFFDPHSPEVLAGMLADLWLTLPPGPDPERESSARRTALKEVKAFGERFYELAKGVL